MYISELKLWNFRKYGRDEWDLERPHLLVPFNSGLNVLIGENDSGKTAILDAIKMVLKTHAYEWIKVEDEDFFCNSIKFRIEIIFKDIKNDEAKNFIEWLGWEGEGDKAKPVLRLIYEVEKKNDRILPADVRAGMDEVGFPLNAEAREFLKSTYLKALRDADSELVAKKNSRVSQILQGHELFKEKKGQPHCFVEKFQEVNDFIQNWFSDSISDGDGKSNKKQIKGVIDTFLQDFIEDDINSNLFLSPPIIKSILEKISLAIEGKKNLGLGTMNRLYMAAELLHLKKEWSGLKLCLIEELEAHLHPQAQMKIVEALLKEKEVQFILTTHSPNLASKVDIEKLIICHGDDVFPLRIGDTGLDGNDYKYLSRFLDVTKANLFFAKGVILVEGWTEEILLPAIAQRLGFDLTKYEVSIVNVGSTAYLHFAKIFLRKDGRKLNIPVSIITDLDVRPNEDGEFNELNAIARQDSLEQDFNDFKNTRVLPCIAKEWTLEWCLFKSSSLSSLFKAAVKKVHSRTNEFSQSDSVDCSETFQKKLIKKLKHSEGTSPIDKVAVSNTLAEEIASKKLIFNENDEYIEYLISAIRHACRIKNDL